LDLGKANALEGDSRQLKTFTTAGIVKGSVNAVVTSPPYATALPYIDTDRLSLLLLQGMKGKASRAVEKKLVGSREIRKTERDAFERCIDGADFGEIRSQTAVEMISRVHELNRKADVGFRRKNKAATLYRYYEDMTKVMHSLDNIVSPEGSLFFVIGDNKTTAGGDDGEKICITSGKILIETGLAIGWNLAEVIPITVTQEDRLHNKNSITENEIVWFKKSA